MATSLNHRIFVLTPADCDVGSDAAGLREDGDKEEIEEVQTLDEYPRVVGRQRVVEQRH